MCVCAVCGCATPRTRNLRTSPRQLQQSAGMPVGQCRGAVPSAQHAARNHAARTVVHAAPVGHLHGVHHVFGVHRVKREEGIPARHTQARPRGCGGWAPWERDLSDWAQPQPSRSSTTTTVVAP